MLSLFPNHCGSLHKFLIIKCFTRCMEKSPEVYLTPLAIVVSSFIISSAFILQGQVSVRFGGAKATVVGAKTAPAAPTQPTPPQPVQPTPPTADLSVLKINSYNGTLGKSSAPLKVYVFVDYACPYCSAAVGINQSLKTGNPGWEAPIPGIIKDYVNTGKVQLVFKEFIIHGPTAAKSAEAALCAQESGKYWEMAQALYENVVEWQSLTDATDKFTGYATKLGLDIGSCLRTGKHAADVTLDSSDGRTAGVTGTPTFFIGGQILVGAQPYGELKKIIDAALLK